jgi:hypothetical protein
MALAIISDLQSPESARLANDVAPLRTTPMSRWTEFDKSQFYPALGTASFWQFALGVPALLVLDQGQMARAFWVAFLCHWAIIWLILFRRPRAPTRLDLAIVRYSMLPLLAGVLVLGAWWLRIIGTPAELIP